MSRRQTIFSPHSLLWRLFGSIAACIAGLLILILLLNTFALKPYYMRQKQQNIVSTFSAVNAVCKDSEALQERLEYMRANDTVSAVIWADRQIVYSTQNQDRFFLPGDLDIPRGAYLFSEQETASGAYITLYGRLANDACIMLRTPVAAIEESIGISNRFLLICGGAALVFALLAAWLLSRGFIAPIRRLSGVAEHVAQLDFSDVYTGTGKDELSALGRSIDTMSHTLERAIGELQNANRQLQADIEQKIRQDEARREFIANVSHELKTPLALIGTYAEGLREDIAGNREEYCDVIEDETQKMSEMLRRMTLLMQLESGGEQLTPERFDVTELLSNLCERLRVQFADTDCTVLPPAPTPQFVWADSVLLENVLVNFLTNAFHHVSPAGVISAAVTATDRGTVRITVLNTGKHIPAADLPKIWESFYKVDKARTRAYGGSGIGLSVVAAIMNAHRMPYGVRNCTAPNGADAVEFYIELEAR